MKKLLSIVPHMSTGGLPQVLVKRVELVKDDLDIYVVEFNNYSNDFIIQKNRLKKLLKPDHFFTLGDDKRELLDIIKKLEPIDFLHMEEIPELFNIDFSISKEIYKSDRKYKIFETTHSSDFNVDDKIFFPDKFLFVSQYNCFKFNKFGIPSEVIEYPVEKTPRDSQRKLELMKKLGLDPKYKHVVNVGLFTPRKNQAYAFEIASKLLNEKIKFHFIGNQADNFQDYWRPLLKDKPKNCVIWGERDDIDDFLDACDLFLFTSRGFRWNKELNPLVIKEALEHQIPQFLFPLDVYNRKYDTEETIHYLDGNVDIDAGLVKNFLFERVDSPWISNYLNPYPTAALNKYKIRAVHLLLEEDDRKSESIQQLEQLKNYGIDYVQHINKRYTSKPPKEMCARPHDVGRIGAYSLKGPHYGNYQSFKKAILTEFTDDVDFLIVFESDCKLNVPIEEFVDKVFQSCDPIIQRGIYYMSFGDNRNLRTGEMVSDNHGQINDWMYMTNKIIGIQAIMFPKFAFPFIKRAYETVLWDVSDLMFNDMFKNKGKAIAPRLTTQIEGVSTIQGENIEHFLLKNEGTLVRDKNPDDIIVEYNNEDQKFHFCLSDFYQNDVGDLSIVVNADEVKNIYKTEIRLSPYNPIWIQIYGHQKYGEFSFDFSYKGEYLFTKKVQLNIVPNNENVRNQIQEAIEKKESIRIDKNDFNIDYDIDENRLYFPYSGPLKDVSLKVVVKNIDTKKILFTSEDLIFNNNEYCNWISTGSNYYKDDLNFNGYEVDYLKDDTVLFTRELILRNKKKEFIEIESTEIIKKEKNVSKNAFIVLTYPNTKIKEDITERCIDSLKSSENSIILSSHYPVNKNIQEKVDYYLYDSYNPLISHSLYNFYWSTIQQGKVEIRLDKLLRKSNLNQSLTVLNNMENSIKFAKSIGIDKVICVSYDFIFNENNLKTIDDICKRIDEEDKKGYFMLYNEGDMKLYKSVFFIINTDFYSQIFNKTLRTPEKYNKECSDNSSHNFLENYFYSKLSKFSNELIIEETNEEKLFNNPNINIFSGVEYLAILPVKNKNNSFIVWFNSSNDKDNRKIEFTFDNNGKTLSTTHIIKERSHYIEKININDNDNYIITAKFIDTISNEIIDIQTFNINTNNYKDILDNGLFTENDDDISNIDFTIDLEGNKISIWNDGEDFRGKISIKDIDSKVPFHWEKLDIQTNRGYWFLPIPKEVFDFQTSEQFNGLVVSLYNMNDKLLFEKVLQTKTISEKIDLPVLNWIYPFDSLYFIWRDFYILKIYDKFLNKINLKTTIDLGANQGLFTHLLLNKGSEKVFAVEALPSCCDNLRKMFDDKVIIINKAISNKNEIVHMYKNDINTTISYSEEQLSKEHIQWDYDKISVEGITINDLFDEYSIDKIDLMKVDIEGDEYIMFENITKENLLKIDNMIIEYHHNNNNEVNQLLRKIKFDYFYQIEKTTHDKGIIYVSKNKNNLP